MNDYIKEKLWDRKRETIPRYKRRKGFLSSITFTLKITKKKKRINKQTEIVFTVIHARFAVSFETNSES